MTDSPRRRRGLRRAGGLVLLVVLVVALQVDDWKRDLVQNQAATSLEAEDAALRPIVSGRALDDLVGLVRQAAAELPRWELVGDDPRRDRRTLRFTRRSALFRFVDDVTVVIEDRGASRVISASSRSRVGQGDLGQNPRNLRALLGRVRALLAR